VSIIIPPTSDFPQSSTATNISYDISSSLYVLMFLPSQILWLDHLNCIWWNKQTWSSSLPNFLPLFIISSSLLAPNILLSTLRSNASIYIPPLGRETQCKLSLQLFASLLLKHNILVTTETPKQVVPLNVHREYFTNMQSYPGVQIYRAWVHRVFTDEIEIESQ
jgi:hypothetical protein